MPLDLDINAGEVYAIDLDLVRLSAVRFDVSSSTSAQHAGVYLDDGDDKGQVGFNDPRAQVPLWQGIIVNRLVPALRQGTVVTFTVQSSGSGVSR